MLLTCFYDGHFSSLSGHTSISVLAGVASTDCLYLIQKMVSPALSVRCAFCRTPDAWGVLLRDSGSVLSGFLGHFMGRETNSLLTGRDGSPRTLCKARQREEEARSPPMWVGVLALYSALSGTLCGLGAPCSAARVSDRALHGAFAGRWGQSFSAVRAECLLSAVFYVATLPFSWSLAGGGLLLGH